MARLNNQRVTSIPSVPADADPPSAITQGDLMSQVAGHSDDRNSAAELSQNAGGCQDLLTAMTHSGTVGHFLGTKKRLQTQSFDAVYACVCRFSRRFCGQKYWFVHPSAKPCQSPHSFFAGARWVEVRGSKLEGAERGRYSWSAKHSLTARITLSEEGDHPIQVP